MADNNNVLTIVLVVAAALLLTGNLSLTGFQVKGGSVYQSASREQFGAPRGSQVSAICYSDFFRAEISAGDYRWGAVAGGGSRIETCDDQGALRAFYCEKNPVFTNAKRLQGTHQYTTDVTADIGCEEIDIGNSGQPESS